MKYLLYILCAAALLPSCQKQDGGERPSLDGQGIQFRTYIEEGGQTRPLTNAESRSLAGNPLSNGYFMTALLSDGNYGSPGSYNDIMRNVAMNADGSYKSSTTKCFWYEGVSMLRHSFIAYSATPSGASGGASALTGGTTSNRQLSVTYANADNPSQQIDFLCAINAVDIMPPQHAPIINLVFQHRLARVMVKLIGTGGLAFTTCQAKIAYKANTVGNSATLYLAQNGATNINSSYHSGTYNLGPSFSLPGSAVSPAMAVEIGDMILIPQSLVQGWATLTLTYTPDGASAAKTATVDMPTFSAATGQQYDIIVNVVEESQNLSVTSVTLTDWKSKTGTIDKL